MKRISENEMVATFLRGELDSTRFGENITKILDELHVDKSIITSPNLKNKKENDLRKKILTHHRGYSTKEMLFSQFPDTVNWYKTTIPKKLLFDLRYIEYSYWTEITGGSRKVKDAIDTIKAGRLVFNQSNEPFYKAAEAVRNGITFPHLILVTKKGPESAIILEGHLRATAYVLAFDQAPDEVPVILGVAKTIDKSSL